FSLQAPVVPAVSSVADYSTSAGVVAIGAAQTMKAEFVPVSFRDTPDGEFQPVPEVSGKKGRATDSANLQALAAVTVHTAPPTTPGSGTALSRPVVFEANRGQIDPGFQFLARGGGYALWLSPTEAVLHLAHGPAAGTGTKPVAAPEVRMQLV